ncbi:hypothetical protein [Amycolatopsis sp. NPDC059657]|uniref:hypothetical protein n=1 Tax=Amycolatopsis sp. NPDC059657 TaxID=3346899 RepID=UPI00366FEB22
MSDVEAEISRVSALTRQLLTEYAAWGNKIVVGEVGNMMYDDMTEFVNLRMETVESCLWLLKAGKVADALGLCRSLLEHYLLYMLMCRGNKYFRLQDRADLTESKFKEYLAERQAAQIKEAADGKTNCIGVEKYPRAKRHVMYIYEGVKAKDEPEFVIPVHYFHFQDFHPETMRLPEGDYFSYRDIGEIGKEAMKRHRENATERYRFYLSYDALLQCLELNGLVDKAALTRIEAHYTFLGKFLHPTHGAARDLHVDRNHHKGGTSAGLPQPYSPVATLLANIYVCYLVASLVDEIAGLFEAASTKYFSDVATAELRELTKRIRDEFSYFWFLFNEPTLYDKFLYASAQATAEEWAELGGRYESVPSDRVKFSKDIYKHFGDSLNGWSNNRCRYRSPLEGR